MSRRSSTDRLTLCAFLLMVALIGGNPVGVKFTVLEMPPFWGAGLRFGVAAMCFALLMVVMRVGVSRGKGLVGDVAYGVTTYFLPFALFYWAVQDANAITGGLFLALIPLLTLLLAAAHGIEQLTWWGVGGALLAFIGMAVVFASEVSLSVPIWSLIAFAGAALSFSESIVVVKLFPATHPVGKNAIGLAVGAILLIAMAIAAGESLTLPNQRDTWLALGYLVVPGTLVVFSIYLFVLQTWTASWASYEGVLAPLSTIVFGSLLLNERLTPAFAIGAAIVLLGVWVGVVIPRHRESKNDTSVG